ncbi:MAG TPA: hypothetical protein VG408_09040, partial [Actinomycetota bacterium]|nr:hypothetical protein [Actinomycetota bacterium]
TPSGSLLAESRWLLPVVALIGGVVVVAAILSAIFSEDPTSPDAPGSGGETTRVRVAEATSFDPLGDDGEEHSDLAHLAHDRDPATNWHTESYEDPLQIIKDGVGLVFDLGSEQTVESVEITSPFGGYAVEIRTASSFPAALDDTELVEQLDDVSTSESIRIEPTTARYWIVWITSLPGGGAGRAEISEVSFFGS